MNSHSHSSADGHLGSFCFWPMINDALINICVQVFFCGSICSLLLGIYIEVEFLGYMVILCSTFWDPAYILMCFRPCYLFQECLSPSYSTAILGTFVCLNFSLWLYDGHTSFWIKMVYEQRSPKYKLNLSSPNDPTAGHPCFSLSMKDYLDSA